METINVQPSETFGIPHVNQYFGVWSMRDVEFNGLLQHAQNVNIQVHMNRVEADGSPDVEAAARKSYEVTADGLAVIPIRGTILKHVSSWSANTSTVVTRQRIREAVRDPDVGGIMLFVDSPGGTVKGIHDLADEIARAKESKPVHAYVEDLAASAGYWLASQANHIVANRAAIVGSIGVFSVVYDLSKRAESEGIKVHVLREGAFKGAGTPGTEVNEEQLGEWQRLVTSYYDDFLEAVAQGRGMKKSVARSLADGRVHKGAEALNLQLVDSIGDIASAFSALANAAGSRSKGGRKTMSQTNDNTQGTVEATPQGPKAATIAELKDACVGASDAFILSQLEAGATIQDAMKAHIAEQRKALEASETERQKAEKVASEKQSRRRTGVSALPDDDDGDGGQAADTLDFRSICRDYMAKNNCSFRVAAHEMGKIYPDARDAFIESCPASRRTRTKKGKSALTVDDDE